MRLAWLTDIHLNFISDEGVDALCAAVAESEPDAVLIGGDISEAEPLAEHLTAIAGRLTRPIYFVLGNHDYYRSSIAAVRDQVARLCERVEHLHWLPTTGS